VSRASKTEEINSNPRLNFKKASLDSPRPLIHISTGVVYASPGVVKIPP